MSGFEYDVVIVGSGPSGIAAATALTRAGVTNIVVFEREADVGGIPRHTHHPSFGLLVFKRPKSGPDYIRDLRKRCPNVRFETNTTVTAIREDGGVDIVTPKGAKSLKAHHIILATGARETPRHGRLVSGLRPQGIMTTGALQQFIYKQGLRPFKRPVIVGTELVSFSALWTLKTAKIKPVAMIEGNARITAYRPASIFARLMGVPIYYNARITDIAGQGEVTQITLESFGRKKTLECDGVIFSGKFVGDNTLARACDLDLNPNTQIPLVDQNWLSPAPNITMIGNAVHPADMGDQCYLEGLEAGQNVAGLLRAATSPKAHIIPITHGAGIKMTTPNMVRVDRDGTAHLHIDLHVTEVYSGPVTVRYLGKVIYQKPRRCMPARRIRLSNIRLTGDPHGAIEISLGS